MACPMGMIGAPNSPCATRARIRVSRLLARPHRNEATVKPSTVPNMRLRQPKRLDSQPVMGVATAVATRFKVMTQAISSWVVDNVPRTCGSTKFASVMVMPNSMLESCTISRVNHCLPLRLNIPPSPAPLLIPSHASLLPPASFGQADGDVHVEVGPKKCAAHGMRWPLPKVRGSGRGGAVAATHQSVTAGLAVFNHTPREPGRRVALAANATAALRPRLCPVLRDLGCLAGFDRALF